LRFPGVSVSAESSCAAPVVTTRSPRGDAVGHEPRGGQRRGERDDTTREDAGALSTYTPGRPADQTIAARGTATPSSGALARAT